LSLKTILIVAAHGAAFQGFLRWLGIALDADAADFAIDS
jgi:hypothetical protein